MGKVLIASHAPLFLSVPSPGGRVGCRASGVRAGSVAVQQISQSRTTLTRARRRTQRGTQLVADTVDSPLPSTIIGRSGLWRLTEYYQITAKSQPSRRAVLQARLRWDTEYLSCSCGANSE